MRFVASLFFLILINLTALPAIHSAVAEDQKASEQTIPAGDLTELTEEPEVWDPIEPVNRGIFWFNNQFDRFLLEPVAEGYDYVLPKFIKKGVSNFFNNLKYPSHLLSDLVQLKFDQVGLHTSRFLLNSTVGIVGFMDIADFRFGLKEHREDFGTALGYYGIGGGPYLVLPLLGPSNVRDLVGEVVDGAINPINIITYAGSVPQATQNAIVHGTRALNVVNTRARLLEAVRTAKASAVDYYLFIQSAYRQSRQNDIYDGKPPGTSASDSELDAQSRSGDEVPVWTLQN